MGTIRGPRDAKAQSERSAAGRVSCPSGLCADASVVKMLIASPSVLRCIASLSLWQLVRAEAMARSSPHQVDPIAHASITCLLPRNCLLRTASGKTHASHANLMLARPWLRAQDWVGQSRSQPVRRLICCVEISADLRRIRADKAVHGTFSAR